MIHNWITGLNAPKGLGMYSDRMYAADISDVVVVNIPNGRLLKKIPWKEPAASMISLFPRREQYCFRFQDQQDLENR